MGPHIVDASNCVETAKKVKAGEHIGPAKSLAEALARIYADGGRYVQKTGQMNAGPARYSFAKEGDFIAVLRPLMEAHGVTVRPVTVQVLTNESFERKNGGTAYRVVILVTFEFLHASGDKATAQTVGEGQDSGDKAFNKAMTAALKYALRQTFCVETGDDPDDTPSHEQERAPVRQQAPAAKDTLPPRAAEPTPAKDNPSLRAKVAHAIATAQSREQLSKFWHEYDGDVKAGRLGPGDKAALDPLFKEAAQRFPAPSQASVPGKK